VQREVVDGLHLGRGGDPDGVPVVLVHGAMDRGAAFLRATRLLRDLDWWVYDRRGYGRSRTERPADMDGHVADLIEVIDLVAARRGRPVVVVGHSLGGTIALAAAQRRPDVVESVAAYESPLTWEPWWPRHGPGGGAALEDDEPEVAADRFMRRVAGEEVWESLPEATRRRRLEEGATLVTELSSARRAAPFDPSAVAVPCLIARGAGTDEHRTRAADQLAATVPGAELVVMPGADHGVHTSDPQAFAYLVRRSVGRAGPGAAPTP
jgi:pimeloyl-ACP methyl ester carboxylesterase